MNSILAWSRIFLVISVGLLLYLLFLKREKPTLPYVFTADTAQLTSYLISFQSDAATANDYSAWGFYDMENLTIGNLIDGAICSHPECPHAADLERVGLDFVDTVFKVYDLGSAISLAENHSAGERRYRIYNPKDNQVVADFASVALLEAYLEPYVILTYATPTDFSLITPNETRKSYSISFYTDYLEFYQSVIYPGCRLVLGFENRDSYASNPARRSLSMHESCPSDRVSENLQLVLRFDQRNLTTILMADNALFELPGNISLESSRERRLLLIFQSPEEVTLTAPDGRIDLYTLGYEGGANLIGGLSIATGEMSVEALPGNLIWGKNEFQVPPFSTVVFKHANQMNTEINDGSINLDGLVGNFTVLVKGKSDEILLNDDSLLINSGQEFESFKELAIPVLSTIISLTLSFLLGLLARKKKAI